MTASVIARGASWLPFVIFLVIIGFKVISAIIKAGKEAAENANRNSGSGNDGDLWQPAPRKAQRAAPPPVPPPVPAAARKSRQAARPRAQSTPPPVVPAAVAPKGVSEEATKSIIALEASDDNFEMRQDHAYDLEFSDVPESSEDAFSLTRRSRKSRKKHVKVNLRGKQLRNAIIAREILAPPRCFDI